MIEIPEKDLFDRFQANGLTKYSYDEVVAAINAHNEAVAEYRLVLDQVCELLAPYDLCGMRADFPPEEMEPLVKCVEADEPLMAFRMVRHSSERFPVAKLQISTAKYERMTARMRKAIEKVSDVHRV